MLTIVLTRHGHTDRSEPDQYLGQRIDIPISARGRSQAEALHDRLADVTFQRVISSPLRRARETADVGRPTDAIETDDRLMEADYGAWEGHTVADLEARWPAERAAWEEDPSLVSPPGGETATDIARRVGPFLAELVAWEADLGVADAEHRVLVGGHSTLNRVLLAVALEVSLRDYRRRLRQDWLNLTVLRYPDAGEAARSGALLLLYNDVAHLRGMRGITWE